MYNFQTILISVTMKRSIRGDDTIFPPKLLFALTMENTFNELNWETNSQSIDRPKINNVRIANDVLLIVKLTCITTNRTTK